MARAFLTIYGATGDRAWLAHAQEAIGFIASNFRDPKGAGFFTAKPIDQSNSPHLQRNENVLVARTANLLSHYTGSAEYEQIAKDAMRYLAASPVVDRLPASSGATRRSGDRLGTHCTSPSWATRTTPRRKVSFKQLYATPQTTNGLNGGTFARVACPIPTWNIRSSSKQRRSFAPAAPARRRSLIPAS